MITGASSGIGEACARRFAQQGFRLILTARREDRLEALSEALQQEYTCDILTLCFDVRDRESCQAMLENLPEEWAEIDILINNAGLAVGLNPLHEGDWDDWERMIDTNIKGLLYISRILAPRMVAQGHGHIVNIGSIAGREVYPNGVVYSATKHAVDALTKGMRMDLLPQGIRVSQIAPGAVETEFSLVRFKGDAEKAGKVYQGYQPLRAEDIAEAAWFITQQPPHVNINDMLIMPTAQAAALVWHKESEPGKA